MVGEESPGDRSENDSETGEVSLVDELGARLAHANDLQAEADALTGDIAELELANIESGLQDQPIPDGMSPDDVARIGELLVRRAELRDAVASFGKPKQPTVDRGRELSMLNEGIAALNLWLNPPAQDESKVAAHGARIVLLIIVALACWGAWVWHPILLALIIPVAAPIGLLLNRGDDKLWRRLGARRNFQRTGLDAPADWAIDPVQARHDALLAERSALESRIEADRNARAEREEALLHQDFAELQLELVETEQQLAAKSRRHGLELEEDNAGFELFRDAARIAGERRRLKVLKRERTRLVDEESAIRDAVWRSLRDRGVITEDGAADRESLQLALQRLRAESGVVVH